MTSPSPLRRDRVIDLLAAQPRALHVNEIASRLGITPGSYQGLQRLLDDLSFDGTIVSMTGQRFRLSKAQVETHGNTVEGVLNVNPRGFGFVPAPGLAGDIYLAPESLGGALHGDTVVVKIVSRSHRGAEGTVRDVTRRRSPRIAGTLRRRGKSAWLEPDDARVRGPIVLDRESAQKGEDGNAAIATITRFPEMLEENPEGELTVVLGAPGDPLVEVKKILAREGVEEDHPVEAVAEAESFGAEVAADALLGRVDLTHIPLPTIDPEDARDHDDAVWVTRDEAGHYKAWIAIADVSHYVRPGTALDEAALTRGVSIYLPDRAIPMLPRALSSNLCSLLPNVIRLCLCVEVDLDATGTVLGSRIVEGFMRSSAKLTYPGVARALGFTALPERSPEAEAIRADLEVMWDLARLLRGRRMRKGALDFDLPEAKITLEAGTGAPIGVEKRAQDPGVGKAYQLIEELMLLANETCARFMVERDVPAIFRSHGVPDEAKLDRLSTLCAELGVKFEMDDARDPKRLSAFLKKLQTHPKKQVLHMLLLRAMKQAVYDVQNVGHFGLASEAYLHFTSPIRRYPDLVVHREMRAVLRSETIDRSEKAIERLRLSATTASDRERKAMEIEREVVDLYRALLMKDKIGMMLSGIVTGMVGTGVFVNIDAPFLDVLVRMESLGPDGYALDDEKLRVIGQRSGERISLGDEMTLVIEDVSLIRRTVYGRRITELLDEPEVRAQRRKVKRSAATVIDRPGPAKKKTKVKVKAAKGGKKKVGKKKR